MALITNLKIGRIDNLSDARYAAGVWASYAGFCFELNNPHYLTPEKATAIMGWLQGPKMVGEFDIQEVEEINTLSSLLELDFVQLRDLKPKDFLLHLDRPAIQCLRLDEMAPHQLEGFMAEIGDSIDMYQLSFTSRQVQEEWLSNAGNRQLLLQITRAYKVLFDFYFNSINLMPIIEGYGPYGINLYGQPETKPGYKDFTDLIDLVELLELGEK